MDTMRKIAELVASQTASDFFDDRIGDDLFLASEVENLLTEYATLIYHEVDDPQYYGMALSYDEDQFVAINTNQPLRIRYYSGAHELWHLIFLAGEVPAAEIAGFDHERAADHFAAALMLPKRLVLTLLDNLDGDKEKQIIRIADLSSMPYQAVVRRVTELGKRLPKQFSQRSEAQWIQRREVLGISPSALDKADRFTRFTEFLKLVDDALEDGTVTLDVAANLVKNFDKEKAEAYWRERKKKLYSLNMVSEDDSFG